MPEASYPRLFTVWIVAIVAVVLGWQMGMRYQQRQQLPPRVDSATGSGTVMGDPEKEVDVSLLWEAWRVLQQYYIAPEELKKDNLMYGAVEGLVRGAGDPYTVFMTPQEDEDFRESLNGTLEGIGAELMVEDGLIVVVTPLKGSPAERAGLLPDDIILEVDGQSTDGLLLHQVVSRIRGKKGTRVQLKIFREGEDTRTLSIVRDAISVPSVESKFIEQSGQTIGYVALNQFGEHSMEEVRTALQSFRSKKLKGIILDLRYNGGGYLDGATILTSFFLSEGTVVTVEKRGGERDTHRVTGRPIFPDTPLVVLINQGSASASEIVAGALQDYGRAKIIGMQSFGKGTVQEVIDLSDGSSMRVTVAHWLTPKGKNLAKGGVTPDIVIDRTAEEARDKKDPQLDAATAWLLEGRDVAK